MYLKLISREKLRTQEFTEHRSNICMAGEFKQSSSDILFGLFFAVKNRNKTILFISMILKELHFTSQYIVHFLKSIIFIFKEIYKVRSIKHDVIMRSL